MKYNVGVSLPFHVAFKRGAFPLTSVLGVNCAFRTFKCDYIRPWQTCARDTLITNAAAIKESTLRCGTVFVGTRNYAINRNREMPPSDRWRCANCELRSRRHVHAVWRRTRSPAESERDERYLVSACIPPCKSPAVKILSLRDPRRVSCYTPITTVAGESSASVWRW